MERNSVKKICIFLMKVHRLYYMLLGVLTGLIVYSQVARMQDMMPLDGNPLIPIFLFVCPVLIQVIAYSEFYTWEERKAKRINGEIEFQGRYVKKDHYFAVKINNSITITKQFIGYIYAIFWSLVLIEFGYFISLLICLYINKGV